MSSQQKRPASPGPNDLLPKKAFKHDHHIDDFRQFKQDVQAAVSKSLPTGGRRYTKAAILAITFSNSDIAVQPLREELLQVFETKYNWAVVRHEVDCSVKWQDAVTDLIAAIASFVIKYAARAEDRSLLTYYFSGHGYQDARHKYELYLFGAKDYHGHPRGPRIKWETVIDSTRLAIGSGLNDQLCILDCCSAGLASLGDEIEVLAATSWGSPTPANPQQSFTRALVNELKACKGSSITAPMLMSRLYSQVKIVKQGFTQPIYKPSSDPEHAPALIHRITTTPAPLPQAAQTPRHAHVMISVKVRKANTVPDAKEFIKWLKTNVPSYVADINIVTQWQSGSVTVLVLLPIEIWLVLRFRPGYAFLDYRPDWDAAAHRATLGLAEPQVPQARSGNVPGRQDQK